MSTRGPAARFGARQTPAFMSAIRYAPPFLHLAFPNSLSFFLLEFWSNVLVSYHAGTLKVQSRDVSGLVKAIESSCKAGDLTGGQV
jgi:hypothetical protein